MNKGLTKDSPRAVWACVSLFEDEHSNEGSQQSAALLFLF